MSEDIETRLQAMYHSGQVSAYIISKLPEGKLTTGWIEQGLLNKGFTGNLQDKQNQENLIIPIDRFARLTRDYDDKINLGLIILGAHGLDKSKLISLVSNQYFTRKGSINAIGFNSDNIQTLELIRIIARLLSEKTESTIDNDPNLDYIEELLTDAANGDIRHLLSLSLPSGKPKLIDWIRKILKSDLKSKAVLAQIGDYHEFSPSVLLLSRWLLGLEIFKKTKNAIASILLVQGSQIVLCFWDSPQNLATFAIIEGIDIERVLRTYTLPLWYTSSEATKDEPKGPKVLIEKSKRKESQIQKRASSVTRVVSDSVSPDNQSISIVRTRIAELINRLSPLTSHLDVIEKRITKIIKDTRFQSMSEYSENATEDLRSIKNETKIIEDVSVRLRQMENQIDNVLTSDSSSSPLNSDEIQGIISKMSILRELIDKIEIKIDQLDSRVTEIETLRFKRRTES
ncbi:MAG: hypothetical protein ACTSYJ_11190 [Candidatus Thorarchaeota archaeon]